MADPNPAGAAAPPPPGAAEPQSPEPPRRVIRTFASDMALLQGQPVPVAQPIPKEALHASGTDTLAESVAKIPVAKDVPPVAPPAHYEPARIIVPPKQLASVSSSGGIFEFFSKLFKPKDPGVHITTLSSATPSAWASTRGATASVPEPISPPPAPEPIPVPVPTPEPMMPAVQPAASDTETREAVLARLRAKIAAPPAPPPVFSVPNTEVPAPERLRTYKNDFSTRVDTQQASAFSVLAAQADARPTPAAVIEVPNAPHSHTFVFVIAGTLLFVGGSLGLYYAYTYMGAQAPVPIVATFPTSLVAGDDTFVLTGSGDELTSAFAAKTNEPLTIGTVRIAYIEVSSSTPTGVTTTTEPGGVLFRALKLPAPDILVRNIARESTVGIIHAGSETRPFFVLGAQSYERTFAGMLSWEPSMATDLAALYPTYPALELVTPVTVGTTTATSTPPAATSTPPKPIFKAGFTDEVVESHDVRAYKDSEGRTVFLYGYRDQHTLIIARDETAFSVLLARLAASGG